MEVFVVYAEILIRRYFIFNRFIGENSNFDRNESGYHLCSTFHLLLCSFSGKLSNAESITTYVRSYQTTYHPEGTEVIFRFVRLSIFSNFHQNQTFKFQNDNFEYYQIGIV